MRGQGPGRQPELRTGRQPTRSTAPALQLVLERLWRDAVEAGEHTLTLAQLTRLGGLEGIRENYVGAALDPLPPAEQEIVARCFSLLAGSTKTKVAYPASVLAGMAGRDDEREVTAVLDKLCVGESGRILTAVDTGQGEGSKSYELFNAGLLAEPVVKWQKEYDEEQRRKAEEERRLAMRRKYRNRSIVLVTLVVVFAALCGWAFVERHTAIDAKTKARSIALASIASTQLPTRPDIALLLSLAAYGTRPTVEAESSTDLGARGGSELGSGGDPARPHGPDHLGRLQPGRAHTRHRQLGLDRAAVGRGSSRPARRAAAGP